MVEFIVGLVAILVLAACLIQMTSLALAQLDTMTEARRLVGQLVLQNVDVPGTPRYIRDWIPGDDGHTYSRDDEAREGDVSAMLTTYVEPTIPGPAEDTVMGAVPRNPLQDLRQAPAPAHAFGLFSRRATDTIDLLPAVRHLLYNADSITIDSEVWMTSSDGIY